jgi:hypothetical protein
MGKVEQHEDAVDHGVAQGNQSVKTPPLKRIDEVLHEEIKCHAVLSPNNLRTEPLAFLSISGGHEGFLKTPATSGSGDRTAALASGGANK